MNDQDYMRLALEEAWKGCGFVNPNPMVGAVIVKNGRVIGRGAHERMAAPMQSATPLLTALRIYRMPPFM